MCDYLKPINDEAIKDVFLLTLLNSVITDDDRSLFSLPVRSGGLVNPFLSEIATNHFDSSMKLRILLMIIMILQSDALPDEIDVKHLKQQQK